MNENKNTYCFENALVCMNKDCPAPCRIILDNVADGIFTVNKEGNIAWFNRAAEKITGFLKDEALGKHCRSIFQTELCGGQDCPLQKTIESQESIINMEVIILHKSGRQVPVSISTAVIKDGEGNLLGAVETFRDLSEIKAYQLDVAERYAFHNIITKNTKMLSIFNHFKDIALSDSPILISGESGTGKELIAKAIHDLGRRKDKPYITVNCGALPDTLMESELFGYRKGAFTDAKNHKPGRFALAEGGTLFLDEIGDLPLDVQVKLLRVLQGGEYQPLGSTETLKADVRIITATNKDLFRMMQAGQFREDLFYRINVVQIDVPPLRERKEDIPLLMSHFLKRFNKKMNKEIRSLSPSSIEILINYDYPGNIRELENIVEYAFILCKSSTIEARHLPPYLLRKHSERVIPSLQAENSKDIGQLQIEGILETLKKHRWNRQTAAAELGISRTTLWRKLKRYQIAG